MTDTQAQHTPGPWRVVAHEIWAGSQRLIMGRGAYDEKDRLEVCIVRRNANLQLAATAPKLFAACKEAAEQGQHADGCGWWDIPVSELNDSPQSQARQADACTCYLAACKAAIAEATGDTP